MSARRYVSEEKADVLDLHLLDGFYAEFKGRAFEIKTKKGKAVLAALALSPHGSVSRERIRGLLWSNSPENRAQFSLRNTIWQIKTAFEEVGYPGFQADRLNMRLEQSTVRVDARALLQSLSGFEIDARLRDKPDAFAGLLYGFEGLDPSYDSWLHETRAQLQQEMVNKLETLLRSDDIDPRRSIPVAKLLVENDGLNEEAAQALIRAYHATGANANALSVYQSLWNQLDEAYGEEPSPSTQELIVQVKTEIAEKLPATRDRDAAEAVVELEEEPRPRIFVERADLSGIDQKWRHILEGFRQDLAVSLIRFREWQVIDLVGMPKNKVAALMTSKSYVLALGGYNDDRDIHLTLTFKDLVTGIFVWSERTERQIKHWKGLQGELVRRIAVALNIHLSADRLEQIAVNDEVSLDAYDKWLLGQQMLHDEDPESWSHATEMFQQVTTRYPDFSRGYSGLAQIETVRHLTFPGLTPGEESKAAAFSYARRAVELDPLDSRSQLCLGWSCAMQGQFGRAEIAFELAYQNNINDPWTIVSAAVGLAFCDRLDLAKELSKQALSMDLVPSKAHWSYQAVIYFIEEDFERCAEACELAGSIFPDTRAWHAAALMQLGRGKEARRVLGEFVEQAQSHWASDHPANEIQISEWLFSCYPFRNAMSWQRFRDGLSQAGLAVPKLEPPMP